MVKNDQHKVTSTGKSHNLRQTRFSLQITLGGASGRVQDSVAGVAAAVGGNALGGTGAAPMAQLAGLKVFFPLIDAAGAQYWQSGVDPATGGIPIIKQ